MYISVSDRPNETDAERLLQAATRHPHMTNFHCAFESAELRLPSSVFEPMKRLAKLTTLLIRTERYVSLTDQEYGTLAHSMPQLRDMMISIDPANFEEKPPATFRDLSEIARGCPKLQSLGISIDAGPSRIPAAHEEVPSFEMIGQINFGLSKVVDVWTSVTFLERLCRRSGEVFITSGLTDTPARHTSSPALRARETEVSNGWEEVNQGVQQLQDWAQPLYDRIFQLEEFNNEEGEEELGD